MSCETDDYITYEVTEDGEPLPRQRWSAVAVGLGRS